MSDMHLGPDGRVELDHDPDDLWAAQARPTTTENHSPAPTTPTTPRSPVGTPFRHQNDAEEDRL